MAVSFTGTLAPGPRYPRPHGHLGGPAAAVEEPTSPQAQPPPPTPAASASKASPTPAQPGKVSYRNPS